MLIKDVDVLYGRNLDHVRGIDVRIADGTFARIRRGIDAGPGDEVVDGRGLLMIPGFVNAHTHIGDSVGKDVAMDATVDERIHPMLGIKSRILEGTPGAILEGFMENACRSMIRRGITTFADFREGGLDGVMMLRRASAGVRIRAVALGRIPVYHDAGGIADDLPFPDGMAPELDTLLGECDGLGISGANENSDSALRRYSRTGRLRAIHSSETLESTERSRRITGRSETARALLLRPHFLVHMTHAAHDDLRAAAGATRGIVVCPRANSALSEGIPDIPSMWRAGCTLALGTDNVMVNPPDMFREMEYAWKVTMGIHKRRIDPREILKMATVNGGVILGRRIGAVMEGMLADCILVDRHALDLEPMHSPHAALVHRATESAVRTVITGGVISHEA